jgi:predicted RND superfamily exporter protein
MLQSCLERLLVASQRRSTAVLAVAAALAVLGGLLITRLSFDANVLRLLPRDAPSVQAFERFLLNFGSLDHLYVVFESADPIGGHSDLVDAYVEALRKAPEIESVDAALFEEGKDWTYLYDRELHLLGATDAALALSRLRSPALDRELAHSRELLQMPSAEIKTMVQQDPLGMLTLLRNRFARQKGFVAFDPTQEGYVSPDGRSRLVMVKPKGAPFDTDFCKALFRRLEEIERTARASVDDSAGGVPLTIFSAGAYRVALEAESLIRRETIVNSLSSLVLLLAIVIGVFRTPWILVYGTVPLALAAMLALGLSGLIVGRLSPATSGSAAMLFGLGIDGIALLYMRYLEEREKAALPGDACRRMAGTAVGVLIAQLTTAATFFALLFIDFPSLRDLGGLVGTGILLSCAFTLVLLPALLSRDSTARGRTLTAPWLGNFVVRHARAIVVTGVLATVVLGSAATRLRVNMGLERLQARTTGADLEREVAARFSLPTDVLLVVNESATIDPLLDVDARLSEAFASRMPAVAVSGISLVLPPAASQQVVAEEIRRAAPSIAEVARDVRAGAARVGFRPEAFEPFIERLPRLLDADARITHDGLLAHGLDPIVSRFIAHRDGRYLAVTYLYPPQGTDLAAIEAIVHTVDRKLELSGLPAIDRDLERRFPWEFGKGLLLGTAAVALLIYAAFRTVRLTVLALLPMAVGFVWSAGWLALARVELDLFSMFAAVTCVGIAVNYGIYVLHRYAIEGSQDVREVLTRTGAAIMIACATALVGFGTLIISSYPPLRMFGLVSVVTLLCCLIASLLLLPALLIHTRR